MTRQRTSGRAAHSGSASILQITDLHLLPEADSRLLGVDTGASLDAVLGAALSEHAADALLVTGDIAHVPTAPAYARARALIEQRYRGRVVWLPGNHDLGSPLERALVDETRVGDQLELGAWSIIAIDTHVDGAEGGCVAPAELARLRERLAGSEACFVIVVGHHPPQPIGTPWLDKGCIRNGAELLDVLGGDARVKAYVCGHVHQDTESTYRGVRLLTTPSTCFQFVAGTERFSVDATPPGWRWLELAHDGTLSTRVGRATDFAVTLDVSKIRHAPQ